MGTKEQLLALLETQKDAYLSGEEIAERLDVSRTAVWKAVKSLRDEGYPIDAVRNRGYCLSAAADMLSVPGIRKYLNPGCAALQLEVLPTASSTNTIAREKAMAGAPEGYTVLALTQTAGRGRNGRAFYSPSDTGIYMSLLLRPHSGSARQAARLTTIAAVAVCEAIEAVSQETPRIKWVNDIYLGGKKVCGILTEASVGLEDGCLEYAILGIGINVSPPAGGFPGELESIAGAVFPSTQSDGKNRLAAEVLNRFMAYYTAAEPSAYVAGYRARSLVIGKEIRVAASGVQRNAVALDLDEDCRLIVQYEDGSRAVLSSGEIHVNLPQNSQ